MMQLIERYVYAVTEFLPTDIREDVGKELRTNIEDMLPDDYTEQDVYRVLEELGNPRKLANDYNPKKRYLIGPGYYDKYISMLKLVIGICISVFIGITLLVWVLETPFDKNLTEGFSKLFIDVIFGAYQGAFQGVFWVTVVFIILERSGVEAGHLSSDHKEWTPDDLPEIPISNNKRISRGETIFSLFCTILFTAMVCFKPQLIALYIEGNKGTIIATPLFDIDRLQSYMIIIVCFAICQIGILIWEYITESWNISLAIANAIYNASFCVLLIIMLSDHYLFNTQFFTKAVELTKIPATSIMIWAERSKWIFIFVVVAISIGDSIMAVVKSTKKADNSY